MIAPVLPMRDFADPQTLSLEAKGQAWLVIHAIEPRPRHRVDLDFSGMTDVSREFTLAFIRPAQM